MSQESITKMLVTRGWAKPDVDAAFEVLPHPVAQSGHKRINISLLFWVFATLVLVGGGVVFAHSPLRTAVQTLSGFGVASTTSLNSSTAISPTTTPSTPENSSTTITISDTSTSATQLTGWKTYVNTTYGFSIQYPADWSIHPNALPYLFGLEKIGPKQSAGGGGSFDDGAIIGTEITGTDGKEVQMTNTPQSPDEWVKSEYEPIAGDKTQDIPISSNGFIGTVRLAFNNPDLTTPWGEAGGVYKVLPSGRVLLISWERMNIANDFSCQKYLLPMLSSFKLLK
ncbi:MAG: hypothetical protein ACYC6X_03345 [Minisyncoccota bacterium]